MSKTTLAYYGELKCQHKSCSNNSYFYAKNLYLCGVHSKKCDNRVKLTKRPKKESQKLEEEKLTQEKNEIEEFRKVNKECNKLGNVIVTQLKMMKKPEKVKGYLKVFPNFKHQFRKDGFGCSKLSPMSLGPVVIFGKNISKNLENFHQGSKCYENEIDKNGNPSEIFFKNQMNFFQDPIGHRHKSKLKIKYFVWKDETGKIHKLDYVTSRQFYCNFYERLATQQEDFKKLKSLISNGTNIQICGYDGRPIKPSDVEKEYLNSKKPFGHELCLFHLLTEQNSENYVWRKHKTFNF